MPVTQILTTAGRISGPQVGWGSIAYTAVDEGQQNTVYLNLNRWDNSDVYWYLVDSGNTAISNSTQVTPNAGVLYSPGTGNFSQSFNFTFNNDVTADGTLTYYIRIENAAGDLLVPRKGPFTCNDTSFSLGQYTFNGTPTAWATTNAASPTYGAYTYPDETSGSLHTLTGSQFVLSGSLGKSPTVNINLWFYPTANNKLIMGEVGQSQENTGWHYSMLEIDSTNHLKGRIWEMSTGPFPTSVGTVTLNAWNHVHLYFDNSTSTFGMSLNNETAVTRSDFTRHVPDIGYVGAYYGIGMYETQFMSAQDRYEGKFDTPVIDTTLTGSNYSSTKAKYLPPLSLVFNQPQGDYLSTPASADWNLGTTGTIEFWLNANNASSANIHIPGGQWGLINQGGWYYGMPNNSSILIGLAGGKLSIAQSNTDDVKFAEPTPGIWTHVAVVYDSGTQKVFYNGVEQTKTDGNYLGNGWTNSTSDLYIGRLAPTYQSHFDGKMAMVRISNTAKYSTAFTATTTYGVEADTKLFLGSVNPLVDSMSHTVTNNGVTTSASFPVTIIITNMSVGFNSRAATVDFTSTVSATTTGTIFFAWGGGTSGPHSVTVNPGSNTYTSPTLSLSGAGSDLISQVTIASGANACTSNIYTGSWSVICLVEGTMITMADGSYKAIEDVGYDDLIRVWNFDLGEFSEALPVFVKREETYAKHYQFTFSDGTVLRTVGHHVFNKQAGAFTMLIRDTTPVGTITFNEQGKEVILISKEIIEEPVRFYNVWTQYHLNLFADGILTSNRFNNIYPIQDMKFIKDNRALRPLEEFANIDPKYISGLRLQEQPAQYTAEYIRDYVESKLERLDIANTTVIT